MSVFNDRKPLLEHMEFKHGVRRGRLAAAMDILSDAQVTIGSHAAYCKRPSDPMRPTRDIEDAMQMLDHVKELIADGLAEGRPAT